MLHSERARTFTPFHLYSGETYLTEIQVARFAVNQYRFPGVEVKGYKRRYYPYGSALTHVIGYVSKINDKDVEEFAVIMTANWPTMRQRMISVSWALSVTMKTCCTVRPVMKRLKLTTCWRVIRQLKEVPPQAGHDIYLTLDLKLQQYIETLLAGSRAAVVVTDPRTGGVLALVSTP